MKLAVIDLGSNSVRLGVYEKRGSEVCEIKRKRFNTRLAEGLEKDNLLKDIPIKRTVEAFLIFKEIILSENCDDVIAVATESLRRAKNSDVFINEVLNKTGIKIKIIDGKEECFYGTVAAKSVTEHNDFYVLDVGGGSFELTKVINGNAIEFICLPYGCVVLSEQFLPDIKGDSELLSFLDKTFGEILWLDKQLPLVILGGSAKEIASYVYKNTDITDYNGKKAISKDAFLLYDKIIKTPINERTNVFGMENGREDIIVAGLATINALIKRTNAENLIFCMKSVRDGVAETVLRGLKL